MALGTHKSAIRHFCCTSAGEGVNWRYTYSSIPWAVILNTKGYQQSIVKSQKHCKVEQTALQWCETNTAQQQFCELCWSWWSGRGEVLKVRLRRMRLNIKIFQMQGDLQWLYWHLAFKKWHHSVIQICNYLCQLSNELLLFFKLVCFRGSFST